MNLDNLLFNPKVSIIICTDGRAKSLSVTIDSLQSLKYKNFEICVVYGPTRDGTRQIIAEWSHLIKFAHCPERNLSKSRNIGLALASGEVVAFLDDDAIPEPEWLNEIVLPFRDPKVAVAGGFLLDHTGVSYQWRYGTTDRLGRADLTWSRAAPEFNFPFSESFPHVIGANSVFRRENLLNAGGFDEHFAYFLDETDAILRVLDSGGKVEQLNGARVHHKFRPSHLRSEEKILTSWYNIVYSKTYFCLVNGVYYYSMSQIMSEIIAFAEGLRRDLEWAVSTGLLSADFSAKFDSEVNLALKDGLTSGLKGERQLYERHHYASFEEPFKHFGLSGRLEGNYVVCIITQNYPPHVVGGKGEYIHLLARISAKLGYQVHVLAKADSHSTVDFEDSVWVHRIAQEFRPRCAGARTLQVPQHMWDYSASVLQEIQNINEIRPVDVIYAPIQGCVGIAALLSGEFNLVTAIQNTLKYRLESCEHLIADEISMRDFSESMMRIERELLKRSSGIHVISSATICEIESAHDAKFNSELMAVIPLGQEDLSVLPFLEPPPISQNTIRILFVGPLEDRKGADILMAALPEILISNAEAIVDIVESDQIPAEKGHTYRQIFESDHSNENFSSRVTFHGEVEELALRGFYRSCDVFVAPSPSESSGLILLEAMMFGKPVVACRSGATVEIVEDGVTGFLIEPGSVVALSEKVTSLIINYDLRKRMGEAARAHYEAHFTPEQMTENVLAFLKRITASYSMAN